MKTRQLLILSATIVIGSLFVQVSSAQSPIRRYVPRRPVFSPYMDYFRYDTGLLDPYNTFRARGIRQNQTYLQQQNQISRGREELMKQRYELQELQGAVRQFRESGASPTGHGAGFMNYSHYFQAPQQQQSTARR